MCLNKVTRIGGRTINRPKFGYKIVGKRKDGTFETWDCSCRAGESHYPLNKWETDKSTGDIGYPASMYPTGFHLYATRTHAVRYVKDHPFHQPRLVAIKCEFSKVVAEGLQNDRRVIIARKIKNLGELRVK